MPRGAVTQTRTFNYDLNTKRLTSATNPENGTVSYVYNGDGTLASKTDAKGQKITYEYNGNQKVTSIRRWVNATTESLCERVNFAYGSAWPSINRLASASWTVGTPNCAPAPSFVESYTYNGPGAITAKTLTMNAGQSLTSSYTYDNEGKAASVKYPDTKVDSGSQGVPPVVVTGPTYNLTYDTLSRPATMRKNGASIDTVKDVLYNVAGQMTQMRWLTTPGGTAYYKETRAYNNRQQLTQLWTQDETGPTTTVLSMTYVYPATQNNGRISQQTDSVSGEQVSYQYDCLNRLLSATTTGPEWGLTFGYDGFGNKLSQTVTKGAGPAMSVTVDGATNRLGGYSYDANGNMTSTPSLGTLSYDIDNRLTIAGTESYGYGPDNKRVYKKYGTTQELYFYGARGERLGVYRAKRSAFNEFDFIEKSQEWLYFGGRRLQVTDRLGSVRTAGRFFPYGEEGTPTANNQDKFATYYRDATGLDYADQRFYSSVLSRFLIPDSIGGMACTPQSWNRYTYVQGDPINFNDPQGTLPANVSYDGGFGCVPGGFAAPGGAVDASSPCAPGFAVVYGGFAGPKSRLQQVWEAFDPLSSVIEDWDYANGNGTRFNITFSVDRFAQGFLPQLAGAGAAGGVILIGGGPVVWTVTVTGAIVLVGVALWQTGILQDIYLNRGNSDPVTLPRANPGRDATGRCNPCPPAPPAWEAPGDSHGSSGGTHWHWLEYNQNPQTCECFPTRRSGPTKP